MLGNSGVVQEDSLEVVVGEDNDMKGHIYWDHHKVCLHSSAVAVAATVLVEDMPLEDIHQVVAHFHSDVDSSVLVVGGSLLCLKVFDNHSYRGGDP